MIFLPAVNLPASTLEKNKSNQQVLFIWIMEPNLELINFKENNVINRRSVLKVMFSQNCENMPIVDQEIEIPDIVIENGLKHLIAHQCIIPESQRQDANFNISYIDLNSVCI